MKSNRKVKVAIIDDGVKRADGIVIEQDLYVNADGKIYDRNGSKKIMTNHGTICAAIISCYASDFEIISLKIFDGEILRTNIYRFVAAIEWCIEKNVDIINLSLGSTRISDYRLIKKLVYQTLEKGIVLISAYSNEDGLYTMPSCMCGVYGVKADPILLRNEYRVGEKGSGELCLYASCAHNIDNIIKGIDIPCVNSFATPTVTAEIVNIINLDSKKESTLLRKRVGLSNLCLSVLPDFLYECLLIDCRAVCDDYDIYDFIIVKKYNSVTNFLDDKERDRKVPLLIIPENENIDSFEKWELVLDDCSERIGVVFAGKLDFKIKQEISKQCLFWDDRNRKIDNKFILQAEKKETCKLFMKSDEKEVYIIAKRIKNFFNEKLYECQTFSTCAYAYLYGMIPLEPGDSIEKQINYYSKKYSLDVAIIIDNKENKHIEGIKIEIVDKCESLEKNKSTFCMSREANQEELDKLLAVLIK